MSQSRQQPPHKPSLPLLFAGLVVVAGLLMAPTLTQAMQLGSELPAPAPTPTAPSLPPTATPSVTPLEPSVATPPPSAQDTPPATPVPTSTFTPSYDYTHPAPETAPVGMEYFSDALFIGDSRTEGLQLYSGIQNATFFCYKGITVFDVMQASPKKVITLDSKKHSIQDALELRQGKFKKVYLSLGINELGYFDDRGFHDKFAALIDKVRATQPEAIIYLQNLAPVNPQLCAKNWSSYVNNDKVAVYNSIFKQLAEEKQVILLDVASALSNQDGILAKENTVDGVHFTKAWYREWLDYLMAHTVEPS